MFTLQYWTKALQQRTKQNNEKFNEAMQKFVGVLDKYARVCNLSLGTMEDKNPWNSYRKPSFHILNLSKCSDVA